MPKAKPPRHHGGRFAHATIGRRIDQLRIDRGYEAKQFYDLMGWDKGEYSRKSRGLTPVSAVEASKAAELLRAPKGWPYISLEEGALVEALGSHAVDALRHIREIHALLASKARNHKD